MLLLSCNCSCSSCSCCSFICCLRSCSFKLHTNGQFPTYEGRERYLAKRKLEIPKGTHFRLQSDRGNGGVLLLMQLLLFIGSLWFKHNKWEFGIFSTCTSTSCLCAGVQFMCHTSKHTSKTSNSSLNGTKSTNRRRRRPSIGVRFCCTSSAIIRQPHKQLRALDDIMWTYHHECILSHEI